MEYKRILLVGGSGYLGRHLTSFLKKSSCIDIFITGSKKSQQEGYFQIDFEQKETFNNIQKLKFDLVIILASKLGALGIKSLNHPDLTINTLGYAGFLQYLYDNQITQKIIYTSSMTVYDSNNSIPVKEDDKIAPVNTYGLSKYLAEVITDFFCKQNNLKGVILRLPGIYGGDKNNGFIYNTIKKAKDNQLIELDTQGLVYWETIFINDLCEMIWDFLKQYQWELPTDIFNVSYGCETDFNTTAEFIVASLQKGNLKIKNEKKGYVPFYLSNEKIGKLIEVKTDYFGKLNQYLNDMVL
jgi:nucleoside-diphosphate-sugar epimerase